MNPILLSTLIMMGGNLLSSLFDNSDEKRKQEALRIQALMKPKINPNLQPMDNAAFQAIMANMGRYQNFGWPEGMGIDLSQFLGSQNATTAGGGAGVGMGVGSGFGTGRRILG